MPIRSKPTPAALLLVVGLAWLATGCGRPPVPADDGSATQPAAQQASIPDGARPDPGVGCTPSGSHPLPDGTLVFGLTDPVDCDHAPVPHNLSETIVFRNLYETLVVADCAGALRPGLAVAWTSDDDDRVWKFRIRADARFWNGAPVTAAAVLAAWSRNRALPKPAGRHSPWNWLDTAIASEQAVAVDELVVTLRAGQPQLPYLLAHPACGVAILEKGWRWPVGSGPGRLRATSGDPAPDLVCHPNLHHPDRPPWHRLTFRVLPEADPRDLFALGANLLLARHQLDVDYYADVASATLTPLPWDRLYLLLLNRPDPPPDPRAAAGRYLSPAAAVAARRDDLVTAVAAAGAAPADHPGFTQFSGPLCRELSVDAFVGVSTPLAWEPGGGELGPETVLHPAGDIDAQRLAERLAFMPTGLRRSVAAPAPRFVAQLQSGTAGGTVLALPREYATSCLTLAGIVARAGWLATELVGTTADNGGDDGLIVLGARLEDRIVPLVYTHAYLVARGRPAGMTLTYEGVPLLGRAGWAAPPGEIQP